MTGSKKTKTLQSESVLSQIFVTYFFFEASCTGKQHPLGIFYIYGKLPGALGGVDMIKVLISWSLYKPVDIVLAGLDDALVHSA